MEYRIMEQTAYWNTVAQNFFNCTEPLPLNGMFIIEYIALKE